MGKQYGSAMEGHQSSMSLNGQTVFSSWVVFMLRILWFFGIFPFCAVQKPKQTEKNRPKMYRIWHPHRNRGVSLHFFPSLGAEEATLDPDGSSREKKRSPWTAPVWGRFSPSLSPICLGLFCGGEIVEMKGSYCRNFSDVYGFWGAFINSGYFLQLKALADAGSLWEEPLALWNHISYHFTSPFIAFRIVCNITPVYQLHYINYGCLHVFTLNLWLKHPAFFVEICRWFPPFLSNVGCSRRSLVRR